VCPIGELLYLNDICLNCFAHGICQVLYLVQFLAVIYAEITSVVDVLQLNVSTAFFL